MADFSVVEQRVVKTDNVARVLDRALDAGGGLIRLLPTWVPRSFLHPGKRLKLHPDDLYAYGAHRGGIDERWIASTIDAQNDRRLWHEGQSFCEFDGQLFLLRDAIAENGPNLIGDELTARYGRWPVFAKFFDNMGPIPFHMHQRSHDAALVGQEGKPESYYFPPQLNSHSNRFPYSFMGLEPGTTKNDVCRCLENWGKGDNGILDLSRAYRLKTGTGWLVPPGVLHAPGSLCTYEPQWGSDVFSMFQSQVEGRIVPREYLVKDVPRDKSDDLDFIVNQLDWDQNIDTHFKQNHFLEPVVDELQSGPGYTDRWIVYGKIAGQQLFSAKELTLQPGQQCVIRDRGASGWITVQGSGRLGRLPIHSPTLIYFEQTTLDEVFLSKLVATQGVKVENTGTEPLVSLRYFGPDVMVPHFSGQV